MTDAVRSTTLAEIRRRAAFRLGDLVQVQATETGTTTTLVDVINLPTGNEDLTRRVMVFTSTDFLGIVARIDGFSASTNMLSFTPKLTANTTTATTADIFNKRGYGFTPNEYKIAINMAIDDAYPVSHTTVEGTASTFDSDSPILTIPTTIGEVYQVLYLNIDNNWIPIQKAGADGYDGWQANVYDGEVIINGTSRSEIDGYSVKIIGIGKHPTLTTDASTTKLHPEWLVARTCYHLCLLGLDRDPQGMRAKQVVTFQQEAEARRMLIWTPFPASATLGRA